MTEATLNQSSFNWRNYYNLCKPKVVYLIVFTAIVGMLLSTPGALPLGTFIAACLGIGLASASGAALNHWVDQRIDVVMERTSNRPLPQGELSSRQALIFALSLAAIAMVILLVWTNLLTTLLTLISLVGYAVIYTMFLKRSTTTIRLGCNDWRSAC